MIYLTLNQIRACSPCKSGWAKLLSALGKTEPDDEPIPLSFILESNGIEDTIWCMRVNWFEYKELYMKFVNNCAERAKKHADAYADAYAYAAAYAAAASAYASASYAASAASAAASAAADADAASSRLAERKHQSEYLLSILTEHRAN